MDGRPVRFGEILVTRLGIAFPVMFGLCLSLILIGGAVSAPPGVREGSNRFSIGARLVSDTPANNSAVGNFSASINRLVLLLGAAGSGLLALVWARVALSWFSNDVTKKVQAKDRARDALIGTLLFTAAITGLAWGLAHWVLTGS